MKPSTKQLAALRLVEGGHMTRAKYATATVYSNSRGAAPVVGTMRALKAHGWITWTPFGDRVGIERAILSPAGMQVLKDAKGTPSNG